GFNEGLRPELHPVQHRIVLESFGCEQTDAAAAKQPVDHEGCLPQAAALLVILEVEVFEAAERAGLQVLPAIDQTDIKLALLPARVVHVLALRLNRACAVAAERREEASVAAEVEVARPAGAVCRSDV